MGEEMLPFEQAIKKIEFVFRYGGINIRNSEITSADYIKSRIIYIINFLWLNMDVAGSIYWFVDGVITGKDFLHLTYVSPCVSLSTLANIKGLLLVLNEKHAHKLVENLRNLEKKEKSRPGSNDKEKIMNVERDFLNKVINVLSWLYVLVILAFNSSRLVVIIVNYYKTGELELSLPFLVLYPFDPFKIKIWPFVYAHQLWSACVVCLEISSADYFFYTCCTYIRIQFKLLGHNLENIIPTQTSNQKFLDDDEFKAKFRDMIKWHQDIIESVNVLEIIYSKPTLFNFVSSSFILCLAGFNVAMGNDIIVVMIFLSFLFMSLFQVFFFCFFADLLMTASMEITDAVYKSQWYMAETSVGKKLLLVQTRVQEPCKLTAFGFADVNLNSFMKVLSTAWSYFALLQTIYGGKQK